MFIWAVICLVALYYVLRIEKQKKIYDIQTYQEIVAFCEGKHLDEIQKYREEGKRSYQKIIYVIVVGLIAFVMTMIILMIMN